MKRLAAKAGQGEKVATHCLRMTAATHLYENTSDAMVVREMLGHADVRTTQRYIGVDHEAMKKGMEL